MKQIKIGRSSDNDIVITDLKVSSHHCRVYESAGSFYVEDTGSLNGVKVNNVLIHERTLIEPESEIVIVSRTFTGDELIKAVLSIDTTLTKCHNIERKYDDLVARYQSNMRMLFDVLHIETRPYACVFESRDVEIEYYVKEYEKKMNDAISMFKLLSASSKKEIVAFHEDMYVLANLIKEAKPSNMREIDELKLRIYDKMMQLQKSINLQVNEVFSVFSKHYEKVFSQFYETCQLHSDKWKKIQNGQIISVPYVLIGYKEYDFSLFEQNVQIKQLLFVPFIKRNNLIVRYQSDQCNIVQNFVTSILGRTLASSLSGNVQIHMMDIKDLGGTSNINRKKYVNTGDQLVGVDHEAAWTLEVAGHWKGLRYEGAYISRTAHMNMDVNNWVYGDAAFKTFTGNGWYVQASYMLFGGNQAYDSDGAKYTRTTSGKNWGDLELAARFQTMDLNDGVVEDNEVVRGVMGGKANMYEIGLNYYPCKNVKIVLNYSFIDQDKYANGKGADKGKFMVGLDEAGEPTKKSSEVVSAQQGVDYHMLALRFQVAF